MDTGSHVDWSFGKGVFEGGDRCHNLGDTYQAVRNNLNPDGDWGFGSFDIAVVGSISTGMKFVDVVLGDGRADHGHTGQEETDRDLLDRSEVDLSLPEGWVDGTIHNWDQGDNEEGVEIVDDIIGYSRETHSRCLRGKIVGHLVVGEPV